MSELVPQAEELAVVIPVHNEAENLQCVIDGVREKTAARIIVVDDASTDNSLAIARSNSDVMVLPLRTNIGAWGAIQTGFRYALRKGFTCVITMDADGQHHEDEISKLLAVAESNPEVDVVIGACPARGSRLRKFAWSFFRTLTGIGIEDITSGFRLYNLSSIKLLSHKGGTLIDYQDMGVLLILLGQGLQVVETPVQMSPRKVGHSHIYHSWSAVAYYMLFTTMLSVAKGQRLRPRGARIKIR